MSDVQVGIHKVFLFVERAVKRCLFLRLLFLSGMIIKHLNNYSINDRRYYAFNIYFYSTKKCYFDECSHFVVAKLI